MIKQPDIIYTSKAKNNLQKQVPVQGVIYVVLLIGLSFQIF